MVRVVERDARKVNGFVMLIVVLAAFAVAVWLFISGMNEGSTLTVMSGIGIFIVTSFLGGGFQAVQPNDSRVLTFFGSYAGSVRTSGFWWINPFTIKHRVSLRVRNFNSDTLKVNDADGNPVEIGA
ncbi:MAG TPA: hypothetical protein VFN03_01640, partial [Trueperaceae bacterium]|nr:hypothetical protein [Trueperaceae bacterium]